MLKALITTSIRSADSFPSSETKLFPFSIYRILLFPLALSQFQRLIFLDHPSGFLVGRTKHFMDAAIDIKDKGTTTTSSSSIQNLRPVDVPIGNVHIVNLSTVDSTLAVSVSVHIHFFNVHSLLNDGELYHGALAAGTPTAKHIMDDVDAEENVNRLSLLKDSQHFSSGLVDRSAVHQEDRTFSSSFFHPSENEGLQYGFTKQAVKIKPTAAFKRVTNPLFPSQLLALRSPTLQSNNAMTLSVFLIADSRRKTYQGNLKYEC
ncbi:hypothetical protein SADUNF_Sadunf01G0001500 [Salix dunnii]|uniref:Uncharacterized protein n=1 Tax=Salix dunnii TaxID=1413687 RepID=A0A835N9H9_9ROSI|nr:hypothetical protein SADUNF_Sadunf01G0001500 [Salix dunnii]